ncbi:HU family DNA-binding protein [Thermostaphylospora chromogena]|uniref:DNA-binding protein HU-beta n=1 Tax=Thermostaphylospora chromogena TaxID=35622 RepID=A0A1H1ADL0_9ACTN|nr:HU family DNA-binding protein [Thermostaphylospora chromogena]SDQ37783.1 DNA-binding protein HU-beta [Thermostaphylospora chromogena]
MNKRELVDAVAGRVGDRKTASEAVNAVIEAIQQAVASGDKVSITGFGAFEMAHKPARTARNPSTGAPIKVEESWTPKFRPGSDFKELVNVGGKKAAKKK